MLPLLPPSHSPFSPLSPSLCPSLLSIPSQQQIFIWWFTQGLCSPGCQQPRSSSAASRWFPGCTLPRFPPVEAAKHCDHTLSSVQRTTSAYRAGRAHFPTTCYCIVIISETEAGVFSGCKMDVALTLRTKVLSLSGISSGMVVLTSTMADRGMLTLGFED